MKYPDCPDNTPDECSFLHGSTCSTLLGWTPEYNRKGELLNSDPNTRSTRISCRKCGNTWIKTTQHGKTDFERKEK